MKSESASTRRRAQDATRKLVMLELCRLHQNTVSMAKAFMVGDHVAWNSEAGHDSGRIVKVHKKDVNYKGHTHHASIDDPQYEIKSDKTDHVALHKGTALRLIGR